MVTEATLQNEQEHDRDSQSRNFQDSEARVFLQAAFQLQNALLERGVFARLP
jgi:hypothetical protein